MIQFRYDPTYSEENYKITTEYLEPIEISVAYSEISTFSYVEDIESGVILEVEITETEELYVITLISKGYKRYGSGKFLAMNNYSFFGTDTFEVTVKDTNNNELSVSDILSSSTQPRTKDFKSFHITKDQVSTDLTIIIEGTFLVTYKRLYFWDK